MERPWRRAALWLLGLGPFFFLSYGFATWVTTQRTGVGAVVYPWERNIPFVPWTIVPYWSIDVLYGISLFVCATAHELDTHARRLLTAQVVAVTGFLLFPLTFTFPRPPVDGFSGLLFESLGKFDKPFNQAPSLHIALLVILWERYARHMPRWLRWPAHLWFLLIGVSVLTTYQHHFIDIPTGALLGFVCLWIWPEGGVSPVSGVHFAKDRKRRLLALYYAVGAAAFTALAAWLGGMGLWLLWLAVSLSLVAANYALFGVSGFQKSAGGDMSLAARWLLAPYIAAAWLNSRVWTRADPETVEVAANVHLGRFPSRRVASAFSTIVDLCAELPGHGHRALPMLDLIVPDQDRLRDAAAMIEQARSAGPVLVCCALGYGRSAAAAATWLLETGRAQDVGAANGVIKRVRPKAVLHDATDA